MFQPHATPPPPRPRRFLRWMFKIPVGCLAFFLGAAVICILFMPWACGRAVREELVTSFDKNYEGTLDIGQTWLMSLYGSQWIEDVELRDPQGRLVLEGRARAPRLLSWFIPEDRENPEEWGPVRVTINRVHVREDDDGITNLARALTARPGAGWAPAEVRPRGKHIEFRLADNTVGMPDPSRITLDVEIQRFVWSNPESLAKGRELRLEDMLLEGSLAGGRRGLSVKLAGDGLLPPGPPPASRRGGLRIEFAADELQSFPGLGSQASWELDLTATDVLAGDLDLLFGTGDLLQTAFGPVLRTARIKTQGEGQGSLRIVELTLQSVDTTLTLRDAHVEKDGALRAGAEGLLAIAFPVDSWWTRETLRPLLPLCGTLTAVNTSEPGRFEMREFLLRDRTGFRGNRGRTRIDLPPCKWALPKSLGAALDEPRAKSFRAAALSLSARLDESALSFDRQGLFADKAELGFSGSYSFLDDELRLFLDWPESWPILPLGQDVSVVGPLADLKFIATNR